MLESRGHRLLKISMITYQNFLSKTQLSKTKMPANQNIYNFLSSYYKTKEVKNGEDKNTKATCYKNQISEKTNHKA